MWIMLISQFDCIRQGRFGRSRGLLLALGLAGLTAQGCSVAYFDTEVKGDYGTYLSGSVPALKGVVVEQTRLLSMLSRDRSAATSECLPTDVIVSLFPLDPATGVRSLDPVASTHIGAEGSYIFRDLQSLKIDLSPSATTRYVVSVSGCSSVAQSDRLITNYVKQDVTPVSSLVASLTDSTPSIQQTLLKVPAAGLSSFLTQASTELGNPSSPAQAYQALSANNQLAQKFQALFGIPVSALRDVAPRITLLSIPAQGREKTALALQALSYHWDPTYVTRMTWKLDGTQVLSHLATYSYLPSANAQGNHVVEVWVGQDNGSGLVDLAKPYFHQSKTVTFDNTYPPTPPSLALDPAQSITVGGLASPVVSTRNLNLILSTGAALANCETFSGLALTEGVAAQGPTSANLYSITCATAVSQTVPFVLTSAGDGLKNIQLWAVDRAGNFSATPSTLSVVLDTGAPSLGTLTVPSTVAGGSAVPLTISGQDLGTGIASLKLQFSSDGGSTFADIALLPIATTSYNYIPVSVNTTTAKLKLIAQDGVGNTSSVISNVFTVTTAPLGAPGATLASAALTHQTAVQVTISDCTGLAGIYVSESSSQPTAGAAGWQACSTTAGAIAWTLAPATEGVHTLYVWSKDAGAAVSTASTALNVTYDVTGPAAPSVTLASTTPTNQTAITLTASSCIDRAALWIGEGSAPTAITAGWVACTTGAGALSYTLASTTEGTRTIKVWSKDAAGNVSAANGSATVVYDITPPAAPGAVLASGTPTNSTAISFTIGDCTDRASILINESGTAPATGAAGWQTCSTTASAITYTLAGTTEGTRSLSAWAKDTAGNVSLRSTLSLTYDITAPPAPSATLTSATPTNSLAVTATVASCAGLAQIFVNEGTQPAAGISGWQTCSTTSSAITYTLTSGEGTHNPVVWAKDSAGNVSATGTSLTVVVDTTAPALPAVSLASATPTNSKAATLTVASCADRAGILVNESTQPTPTDSGWQSCVVTAGGIVYNPATWAEGAHTLNIWAKDAVGNVTASAATVSVVYDITPPAAPPVIASATNTTAVTLTASSCTDATKILVNEGTQPTVGSAGWQSCTTAIGGLSYTLSSGSEGSYTLKVWGQDAAGNVGPAATSLTVTLDQTVPTISSFVINSGYPASVARVPLAISATDPGSSPSGIAAYRLSLSSSFAGIGWAAVPLPTNFSFPSVTGSNSYTLYLQVKDAAGNVSTVASSSVTVAIGSTPLLSILQPDATIQYTSTGQSIRVTWIAAQGDTNALSPTGMNIFYSTDNGATLMAWAGGSGLNPTDATDCLGSDTSAGATGCKLLTIPAGLVYPQTFSIILKVTDVAGKISLVGSRVINAPAGLTLVAGKNSAIPGGSALSTALQLTTAMARDPVTGDIYYAQACQIFVIPAATGVVNVWAGKTTVCSSSGDNAGAGIDLATITFSMWTAAGANPGVLPDIVVDSARNVYWASDGGIWKYDRAQNKAFIWVGAQVGPFAASNGTDRRSFTTYPFTTQLALGGGDTLYFATGAFVSPPSGGGYLVNTFYRVEGNTVRFIAGGNTATPTPSTTGDPNTSTGLGSIAVIPGATLAQDQIFVTQYYPIPAVWQVLPAPTFPNGTLTLIKTNSSPSLFYLKSRGLFLTPNYGSPGYTFLDPASPTTSYPTLPGYDGSNPFAVADDGSGGYFMTGIQGRFISYVDSSNARSTYAGIAADAGDGGNAISAELRAPDSLSVDNSGTLFFRDRTNGRVRKVDSSGVINAMSSLANVSSSLPQNYQGQAVFPDFYGQQGSSGIVDSTGACVLLCGNTSQPHFERQTSMPGGSTITTLANYSSTVSASVQLIANDGTDVYFYTGEADRSNYNNLVS